jgi:hypothetical protein
MSDFLQSKPPGSQSPQILLSLHSKEGKKGGGLAFWKIWGVGT